MTVARGAALGALLLVVAIVVIVLLGGGGGQQYKLVFETAGQLVRGNDVQIGGRRVGGVDDIKLTDDNQAEVTITVEEPYAPLHEGTTATIRLSSLSSVANRYIALTPGANSNPELKADATLPTTDTTSVVDIDQLFNTFDERTRRGLVDVIQGSATQYAGKERGLRGGEVLQPGAVDDDETRARAGARPEKPRGRARQRRQSGRLGQRAARGPVGADLQPQRDDGRDRDAERQPRGDARRGCPEPCARRARPSVDLRAALDDLDPLVEASYPATRDLDRFFREFRPLVDEAVPTFEDLSTFVNAPGPDNDATDLVKMLPQLQQVGSPAFKNSVSAMRAGQPVVDFFRPYSPELVGWLNTFGQASANYDASGHYIRAMANFGAFSYDASTNMLNPNSPSQRYVGQTARSTRRCPGSASQARPDGSNPWVAPGGDCDTSDTLQGP